MITLVCRGCCCGTTSKHPDVDHAGHLDTLADAGPVAVTSCLGPCRWSNVVVAVNETTGEQHWFTKVLDDVDVAAVAAWIASPDAVARPEHLVRTASGRDQTNVAWLVARLARRRRRRTDHAAAGWVDERGT